MTLRKARRGGWYIMVALVIATAGENSDSVEYLARRDSPSHLAVYFRQLIHYPYPVLVSSSSTFLGCYRDRGEMLDRSLPFVQEVSTQMSVDVCLTKCAELGFEYVGLEWKQECYCSSRQPRYEKLKDSDCDQQCDGNPSQICGGALSLSVYQQSNLPRPSFDSHRPLVCLVMILKNERHTIEATLETVKDQIDCWTILDTGSKDGTQEAIETFFKDHPSSLLEFRGKSVPGRLFEEAFIDYGATRNRALILAKESFNPIFTLTLSADERVLNPSILREFLSEMRYARGSHHGAYPVVMDTSGVKFDSIRIARVDSGWRYKGRVHEYLAPSNGPYVSLFRSSTPIDVLFNATDTDRRFESQFYIRRILEEDLAKNPNDTRSIYYLARTNSGISNHSEAFKYYELLEKTSKWDEEVYHGMVMKALESKYLNIDWHDRQRMLLDAFAYKPNSMDALHALAQDHFDSGRPQLAYIYALRAVQLPPPPGLESVENVLLRPTRYLYEYEGHRLLGFCAMAIREWQQCVESFQHVLRVQPQDTIVADRIQVCQKKLSASVVPVHPTIQSRDPSAAASSHATLVTILAAATAVPTTPQDVYLPDSRSPTQQLFSRARGKMIEPVGDSQSVDSSLHESSSHFRANRDTIHLDLSFTYALTTCMVCLAAIILIIINRWCKVERKLKQ